MTPDEFEKWQTENRETERQVDCPACTQTHRVRAQEYFLEGV